MGEAAMLHRLEGFEGGRFAPKLLWDVIELQDDWLLVMSIVPRVDLRHIGLSQESCNLDLDDYKAIALAMLQFQELCCKEVCWYPASSGQATTCKQ
jgi:hypothetical protein